MSEPPSDAEAALALGRDLYAKQRFAEGEQAMRAAAAQHPGHAMIRNLLGVMLRSQGKAAEALAALDEAVALAPAETGPQINRASVLHDLGRFGEAADAFGAVAARAPGDPLPRMMRGRALAAARRRPEAEAEFRAAIALKPDFLDAWTQLAALRDAAGDVDGAEAALDEALLAVRGSTRLIESKVLLLRGAGLNARAEAWLNAQLPALDGEAWVHRYLGELVALRDRAAANEHLRRAAALQPTIDHYALLAQSLARTLGEEEGARLDEAFAICRQIQGSGARLNAGHTSILAEVYTRVCAFAEMDALGDFASLGRAWAQGGGHSALFRQIPRVKTLDDRLELVAQHRLWRRQMALAAEARPIRYPEPQPRQGPIRLGFLSSDLRRHPVGYFVLPLFEHVDPARFELFVYSSLVGKADELQARFAERSTYRWAPDATVREMAQMAADDRLDMLIDLGGSTLMNRLEVMAWRPAPLQASWLGYPHSSGLEAIDRYICDPFTAPEDPRLLVETPLMMPSSWIAMGEAVFEGAPPIEPGLPQDRAGVLTFGTANSPHKYTAQALALWARATASTPGARFLFLRPEGASQAFRAHVLAAFAAEGVAADRVVFRNVRGSHLAHYNEIDITLDTFPLTGGTTTVEALWMGVPVVSLKGPAFFERLSYSILANIGAADWTADDEAQFLAIVQRLAADREDRAAFRQSAREAMRASPLGQTAEFARDFYAMIEGAVRAKA